jgi:hypothetical protein
VTDSGKGIPQVAVDLPARVEAGSVQDAEVSVTNPGPGDMTSVVISFTRVGTDFPIVDTGSAGASRSILSVDPKPLSVNPAQLVYTFGPLPEGETRTFAFEVRIPQHEGTAANAVTAYDGRETDRVKGIRMYTSVE